MNQEHFKQAREVEVNYHSKLYRENEILEQGTWMSKPVTIVMEQLNRLMRYRDQLNVLDLGCGAGRNTIPIAVKLKGTNSKVIGTDLLEEAVHKLMDNAKRYEVSSIVDAFQADVEHVNFTNNHYDYVVASGCLEHVSSEEAFLRIIERMKSATRVGGIHCIVMNTNIQEVEVETGSKVNALIELNLPTLKAYDLLEQAYEGWDIIETKRSLLNIEEEKYEEPTEFRAQALTFVAQKMM